MKFLRPNRGTSRFTTSTELIMAGQSLKIMNRTILLTFLIISSTLASAAPLKVTGLFSNMRFGTEDVNGVEIFITNSTNGYFAQVQCAEGSIRRPVVVEVRVTASSIEFSVPPSSDQNSYSCPSGKFKGVVSDRGIKGSFDGTNWPGTLKRKKSYWQ